MYYWTKKAEEDWRARHPEIKNPKNVLRKEGEVATYDGKPLRAGEAQKAFRMRGWITTKEAKKKNIRVISMTYEGLAWKNEASSEVELEEAANEDKKLWVELHSLYKKGYNIVNAGRIMSMTPVAIDKFIRKNRQILAPLLGEINFKENRARYNYVPTYVLRKAV